MCMKRFVGLLCVAAVVCVFGVTAASAETFRLSNQLPPSHHISKSMELFAEKVEEYSEGDMNVKVFHSGQLFKDTGIVEAIQGGLVEMSALPVNKWSGMIPAADVFEMPFVFTDLEIVHDFLDAGANEILDKEFMKRNAKVIGWIDYGFVQFINSVRPLKEPADFEGLKFRTFSKGTADTVKALGGTPAVISSAEMYMALQRGTVDGATTGMPAMISRKLYEVTDYLTVCNYAIAQFVLQGNLEWWDSLSEGQREVLNKAAADANDWLVEEIYRAESAAQEELAEKGMEIYVLDDAELQLFEKATAPVRDSFAEEKGEVGRRLLEIVESVK
ncbi:MAG: DctP family TRAP transporter solute-binding subunit [Synergistales bacterium]|nr:DctP family TRAP transporter solute-binding subunit [Synergistales bacterium]